LKDSEPLGLNPISQLCTLALELLSESSAKGLRLVGYSTAVGAAILSALMPSVSKPILANTSPLFFTAVAIFCPALVFTPLSIRAKENRKLQRRGYMILAASALVANLIAPLLYFIGVSQTTASNAVLLSNGEMMFTVIIAALFFGERLSRKGTLALGILAVGIVAVITNLQSSFSLVDFAQPGNVLILGSTLCWGIDNNVTSAITQKLNVARLIQLKALISGLGLFALAALFNQIYFKSDTVLFAIVLFGLVIFSGSFFLSVETLRRLGAITMTIVFPINTVFGLFFAFLLLGEGITLIQVASVGFILFGIFLLTRRGSVARQGIDLDQI
jgi:drug/metabolite transporter (DMT)-like permease